MCSPGNSLKGSRRRKTNRWKDLCATLTSTETLAVPARTPTNSLAFTALQKLIAIASLFCLGVQARRKFGRAPHCGARSNAKRSEGEGRGWGLSSARESCSRQLQCVRAGWHVNHRPWARELPHFRGRRRAAHRLLRRGK